MGNEFFDILSEYKAEKNSDSPAPEILELLRNKLIAKITPENINDIIDTVRQETLLHKAVHVEDDVLLGWLIQNNAKLDVKNKAKNTPIRLAVDCFYVEGIKLLYTAGGNIDDIDMCGCTGLCEAIKGGFKEQVTFLLALNANVHAVDNEGQTILDAAWWLIENTGTASAECKFDILRLLFENYIGIGTDLTGIELPPGGVDGLPVIWATKDGQPITNDTPGFENAICSVKELQKSEKLNFRRLQYVLETVFSPYFPGKELVPLYEYNISVYNHLGKIRKNNFEAAGPELEELYKFLRNRTAGQSSLQELATTTMLIQHRLKAEKIPPPVADVKLTSSPELQKLPEEKKDPPSSAALLIKQGLHAEKMPQPDALSSPSDAQNLPNQPVQASENMKLVANAILDPEKLARMPADLVEYIEKLGAEIEEKLGHKSSSNKADPK